MSSGQIIPTASRAFYSAFLTANPRMMEPVYYTEIQCTTKESIEAVFTVLAKRRGSVQNDIPKVGTPHYIIKALIPVCKLLNSKLIEGFTQLDRPFPYQLLIIGRLFLEIPWIKRSC